MSQGKILPRQICALCFCAMGPAAVVLLPKSGWLPALIMSALAAAAVALLLVLRRKCGGGLAEVYVNSWGELPGKTLLAMELLWSLLLLGVFARLLCSAYPQGNAFPFVGLIMLLLAAYAAKKGASAVVRVGAVCFFFLLLIFGLVLAFSAVRVEPRWLRPTLEYMDWRVFPLLLAPVCALFFADKCEGAKGKVHWWIIGTVAITVLCALVTIGSVSPPVAADDDFPFYMMTKSISVFGAMERFEAVVSAALTAGGFCLMGMLCMANARKLHRLFPKANEKSAASVNLVAGAAALWLSFRISATWIAAGTAIFWGILPLLTLLVGVQKKSKFFEKKS
ncbi:MAG: GerAB/ArcD/ProY family transporter [Oscillospiraceae bacterium]|jgi:hypothetical protein|nr:GerAB/ArcD/ProY family transporter [Oscillospiraceae bacterium]